MGYIIIFFIIWCMLSGGKNTSINKNVNLANATCPYCNTGYYLTEDGDFGCEECGELFRYRNGNSYKQEERLHIVLEKACLLFTILCKADGTITKKEVKTTKELLRNFYIDTDEEMSIAIDILNKSKDKIYSKNILVDINKIFRGYDISEGSIESWKDFIIESAIEISYCDGEPSTNQNMILDDIVSVFNISATKYTNLLDEFRSIYIKEDDTNYYKILGVSEEASKEEIKSAFRKLSKLYHPDVYSSKNLPPEIIKDFEEKLAKINEAYSALK